MDFLHALGKGDRRGRCEVFGVCLQYAGFFPGIHEDLFQHVDVHLPDFFRGVFVLVFGKFA